VSKKADFQRQIEQAGKLDAVDPTVAKLMVESGLKDGDAADDKVQVSPGSWSASSLKPSQTTMVLSKAVGMALGMLVQGKVGGDLGAMISSDGFIMDGHHRWAGTVLASGSKGKVGGYRAALPGEKLLKVLNVISKGAFNVRNGNPGSGTLADFTPKKVRSLLEDFLANGMGGKFPIPANKIKEALKKVFGSEEKGVAQISENANLIPSGVPGWAPDRKQMPVIDADQASGAAKLLSQGEVDWNNPFTRRARTERGSLIRLASAMPVGSPERRVLLNALKR